MKITDPAMQDPEFRRQTLDFFNSHTETLRSIQHGAAERAEKYLVITNGGGVVATLSFMGALPTLRTKAEAWWALGLFVAGLVLCGALAAINFHNADIALRQWIKDRDRFFRGDIAEEDALANLNRVNNRNAFWAPVVGYLAYVAFIAGCGLAILRLRP